MTDKRDDRPQEQKEHKQEERYFHRDAFSTRQGGVDGGGLGGSLWEGSGTSPSIDQRDS
ncbi:hypothetical protein [Stieleria varia]|uniref:hypothetical protein n=1 Tax=Stieleria varia TaxID=2528005 RepID=UPI0018D2676D|nr:hypothetical protein [Stieleria varia]